jgi:hypothetical protein
MQPKAAAKSPAETSHVEPVEPIRDASTGSDPIKPLYWLRFLDGHLGGQPKWPSGGRRAAMPPTHSQHNVPTPAHGVRPASDKRLVHQCQLLTFA